jgi:hypothetical protein
MLRTCWKKIKKSRVLFSLNKDNNNNKYNLQFESNVLLDRLVDPVVVTFSQTFLQSCRISDLHPSAPDLSKSLPRNLFMIIGFQISSYAQIVNLGLAVFPEHVTLNLAPLHLVPDSSSLTLEYQVLSLNLPSCQKILNFFWNFGFGSWNCQFDAVWLSRVWLFGQFEFSSYMFYLLNKLTNV